VLMEPQPSTTLLASERRDAGLRLDPARFRRELRIRGATAGAVARAAHVSPNTLTRCRNGAPISERTLREIVRVLVAMPVLHGAGELLTDSDSGTIVDTLKTPRPSRATASEEDGAHDAEPQSQA
jgi:hypothetical protein